MLLLLTDVGPIRAQVGPCLGPRLLLLLVVWLSWSSLFFVVAVVVVGVVVVVAVVVVDRCWPYVGAGWPLLLLLANVGSIWAQVCPCLDPRLAHVAHILASCRPR